MGWLWGKNKGEADPGAAESEAGASSDHTFLSMVLLDDPSPRAPESVFKHVLQYLPQAKMDDSSEEVLHCSVDGVMVFAAHMPLAIPTGEASDAADSYVLWPGGREEVDQHTAHILITCMGADSATEGVNTLVRFAAGVLKAYNGIGVYHGSGSVTNRKDVYLDMAAGSSPEHLPLFLFIRFQPLKDETGNGLYTQGMEQFGLMNFEVLGAAMEPQELIEFVGNVAHYAIQSGPVINDGDTVGESNNQRILVKHQPSELDDEEMVYRIHFE